jgi:hypothetical protein
MFSDHSKPSEQPSEVISKAEFNTTQSSGDSPFAPKPEITPPPTDSTRRYQAVQAALLAGEYADASRLLDEVTSEAPMDSYGHAMRWLIDYLRWQPFGATWEGLVIQPERSGTPENALLDLLIATRQHTLSTTELEQQWLVALEKHPGPVAALMYLTSMLRPADDRYLVKLKAYQAQYPKAQVFKHLELRTAMSRAPSSAQIENIETAENDARTPSALLLDYSLHHLRMGETALAARALKRVAATKESFPEAMLALANVHASRAEEHLRMQQFLMVMSDTVSPRDQAAFLAYHGTYLAQRGQLSEAIKLWNFCLPKTTGDNEPATGQSNAVLNPMRISCLQKKLFATLWFNQTEPARTALDDGLRLTGLLAADGYARRELAMSMLETRALLSLTEENDRAGFETFRQEFTLLSAQQPKSQAATGGTSRLAHYALLGEAKSRISEALSAHAKTPDKYRACSALYDDTVLLQHLAPASDYDRRKRMLSTVVDGQCRQQDTFLFLRARAQLDLAELHLKTGNRSEAQTTLDAFTRTQNRADDRLPDTLRAQILRRQL